MENKPICFDKYICLPMPHNPPMQDLFYRLQSVGDLSFNKFSKGYKISLVRYEDSITMTEIVDTFYTGLYRLWRRVQIIRKQNE